ncbi:hypothetical protein ACQP2Y_21125 [Actinoplanes sp. CA-051413]|uniref:hypothetical protein n=1 Tax=Actinoplanes sp. CA-051413 TaxID=3239899 RepID=UPI003D995D05
MTGLQSMPYDELHTRWAALAAYVSDIHQPQYNLGADCWKLAERAFWPMNDREQLSTEDRILFNALGAMLEQFDYQDMSDDDWAVAERMLAEYTAAVDARAGA